MRLAFPHRISRKKLIVALAVGAALVALAVGPLHIAYGPYSSRNGALEAMDDAAAGLPLKLYSHIQAQIDYGSRTPGLYCPGGTNALYKIHHVEIDEARWSEGAYYTWLDNRRGEAARSFAYLYNTMMFRLHYSELRQACPTLQLEPYQPKFWRLPRPAEGQSPVSLTRSP